MSARARRGEVEVLTANNKRLSSALAEAEAIVMQKDSALSGKEGTLQVSSFFLTCTHRPLTRNKKTPA
jgi:hypothetical protein